VINDSFTFSASRRLKFSSILPCTAFPSTLVSMLELSPPLPILLLPRVGGLSALSTRAVLAAVLSGTSDVAMQLSNSHSPLYENNSSHYS
jgi:hypothetical protein